jgi:uncharacterized protein (TIGR02147 family)
MKSLVDCSTYREYLEDRFLAEKKQSKGVTLSTFARAFGMSGPAFKMILSTRRNLTVDSIHRVATALKLSSSEHRYFEALVLRDQANELTTQLYYDRKLKTFRTVAPSRRVRTADTRMLGQWFLPALLIYLIDVEDACGKKPEGIDCHAIAKKFGISNENVKKALALLCSSELKGLRPEDRMQIVYSKLSGSTTEKNFVRSVMAATIDRLVSEYGSDTSFFSTHSFSIDEGELSHLRSEMNALVGRFMSLPAGSREKTKVIQLSSQFFTLGAR